MFYNKNKSHGEKQKSTLLESERLRQDIQDLEDALILHSRFKSESDNSVRGMIRQEIGMSFWEYGRDGKLRTFRSKKDLHEQKIRKSDYSRAATIKKQHMISHSTDAEVRKPAGNKENMDAVIDQSVNQKSKMFKTSGTKNTSKDISLDGRGKSRMKITTNKTIASSTGPVRIVSLKEGNTDTRMKTANFKEGCSYGRKEILHANKLNLDIQGNGCNNKDQNDNSLYTVPASYKPAHGETIKVEELAKTITMLDQQKLSPLLAQEVINGSRYTSQFNNEATQELSNNSSLNTLDLDNNNDTEKSSSLDCVCSNDKSGNNTSMVEFLCKKFEYPKLKTAAENLFDTSFNVRKNEMESVKKCIFSYQNQISETGDKLANSTIIRCHRDADTIETDQKYLFTSDCNEGDSDSSVILEKPQFQSVTSEMVSQSAKETLLNNKGWKEQHVWSMPMKEYPHIFNPTITSSDRVIAPFSPHTSTVKTFVNNRKPQKSSSELEHLEHGNKFCENLTQPSRSLSSTCWGGAHLRTETSNLETDQSPSNKSPVLLSHSLLPSKELSNQLSADEPNQTHTINVLSTISELHSVTSLHHFPTEKSTNVDSTLINGASSNCDTEVECWLHNLGLHSIDQFVQIFHDHHMNMSKVQLLKASDLREMGIHDLGPIMRIMKGVQILGREEMSLQHEQLSLEKDKVPLLQDNTEGSREEYSASAVNECNATCTPGLTMSSATLSLKLKNASEDYSVNNKDLKDTGETLQHKILSFPLLHSKKRQDSIVESLDTNYKSKSELDDATSFQKESSDIPKDIKKDNFRMSQVEECFKSKQIASKNATTTLLHGTQSRPVISGKPPACNTTFVDETSVAAHKLQQKQQQEFLKVKAEFNTIDEQKQLRVKKAAKHVKKNRSSSSEMDSKCGHMTGLERSTSLSSIKYMANEPKKDKPLSAGVQHVLSTKGLTVQFRHKGNPKKIKVKQFSKEEASEVHGINKDQQDRKLCKDKQRFAIGDMDVISGTEKKLQNHLTHVEDQLFQKNMEKLLEGDNVQEERLKPSAHFSELNLSQQRNCHSDDEFNSCQTIRKRSSRNRRKQRTAIGLNFSNEQEKLVSPLAVAENRNSNKIFQSDSGQTDSPHELLNFGKYKMDKFVNETLLKKWLNHFGVNPSQYSGDALLESVIVPDGANSNLFTDMTEPYGTGGSAIIKTRNSLTTLEDTATIKSAKNTLPTTAVTAVLKPKTPVLKPKTPVLKPKKLQPSPLRNKDMVHIRGLQQRLAERVNLGHNYILDSIKKVELNRGDIIFSEKDLLGSGTFAQVFKGTYQGSEVAVKRLRAPLQTDDINYFVAEVSLLQELRHPHVVWMLGVCTSADKLPLIVMEFLACGNLQSWLHDLKRLINQSDFYQITHDIAAGMLYLHNHQPPVFHLDLKPKNILIGHGTRAKVADFGFSKMKHEANAILCQLGKTQVVQDKLAWMAPELFTSQEVTSKADVYSFGMILWVMITKQIPYKNCSVFQVLEHVHSNKQLTIPVDCPKGLSHLVERCWDQKPVSRPRFKEVLQCLELLSESGEWRKSKDLNPEQGDHVFNLSLSQKNSTTKGYSLKVTPMKPIKSRTSCTEEIDLISLTSQDEENGDSSHEREYGTLGDHPEYFQNGAKDFSLTDRTSGDQNTNAKNNKINSPSSDKLELYFQPCPFSSVFYPQDVKKNSRDYKHETALELSGTILPSNKLHICTSRSQCSVEDRPAIKKLLPLRHSLDETKAASSQDTSLKSQSFVAHWAKEHTNCKLMDGTFPEKIRKSVTVSDDSEFHISNVSCKKSTKEQEAVSILRKSSSERDVSVICSSDMKLYVPSFHETDSSSKLRNKNFRSGLITHFSHEDFKIADNSVHVTGSLCCKGVDVQSTSRSVKLLNKTDTNVDLNFCSTIWTNNQVSIVPTEHEELAVRSNKSDVFNHKKKQASVPLQQNVSFIEGEVPPIFIKTCTMKQDNKNQINRNKMQDSKYKLQDAGIDSFQYLTERVQPLDCTGTNTFGNTTKEKTTIQHIMNMTDYKKLEPTNEISQECDAEFSTTSSNQKFNLVNEYSSSPSNYEAVEATIISQLDKYISLTSPKETSATMNDLASKININTLSLSSNDVKRLHEADIYGALPIYSKPFVKEHKTLAQASDSESSEIPDDISEDSLSREENYTSPKAANSSLIRLDPDPFKSNMSKALVQTDTFDNDGHEPFMVLNINSYISDCGEKMESVFFPDVSNTNIQTFQRTCSSLKKDSNSEQIQCDFRKLQQDTNGITVQHLYSKQTGAPKCEEKSNAFYGYNDNKLWSEPLTVNSNPEQVMPHIKMLQQELVSNTNLLSEDKKQKKIEALDDILQKNVTQKTISEVQNSPATSPPLSSHHRQSDGTHSKLKRITPASDTPDFSTQEKKQLKPKVSYLLHKQQTVSAHEANTSFFVDSGMLLAQKKLLKPVERKEPSPPVTKENEESEDFPTVISILKKAMADRRFAMHDAQESQDLNSDTSWSIQD